MAGNKFDFNVANQLVQAVAATADALAVKNGQMEKRFGNLHETFKDSGYDEFAVDMTAANKAIEEVIAQLKAVGGAIAKYAARLQEES